MPIYTVVADPDAVKEWQELDLERAMNVLNNLISLARSPHPYATVIERGADDLLYLHVGDVDVIYEIVGQTVRVLGIERRKKEA